jgi:hypothetical protein
MKGEPKPSRAPALNAVIKEILLRQDGQLPTNIVAILRVRQEDVGNVWPRRLGRADSGR